MRLVVTRPEPEAQRTAATLRKLGHEVLVMPMLRIESVHDAALGDGPWSAVVMTSANAARAIATHPRRAELLSLRTFVVGNRTGEVARAAGFADVVSADGEVAALAHLIAQRLPLAATSVLYLAGEDRKGDLEKVLAEGGIDVCPVIVYRAITCRALSDDAKATLRAGNIDGVLHFSQRSAEVFIAAAKGGGMLDNILKVRHYCLSAQVAAAFAGTSARDVHVATHPDEQMLIALIPHATRDQ
jgi:uroporphyrinogen-III synthase